MGDARNPPTILAAKNFNTSALAVFGELFPWERNGNYLTHTANRCRSISSWRESMVHQPKQLVGNIFHLNALPCSSNAKSYRSVKNLRFDTTLVPPEVKYACCHIDPWT